MTGYLLPSGPDPNDSQWLLSEIRRPQACNGPRLDHTLLAGAPLIHVLGLNVLGATSGLNVLGATGSSVGVT